MKKYLCLILALVMAVAAFPVYAADPQEVKIGERIDVGFYEVWLHSDGTTWQDTDSDGKRDKPYNPAKDGELDSRFLRTATFPAKPNEEWIKRYDNIRAVADLEWFDTFTKEQYEAIGGAGKADITGKQYITLNYEKFLNELLFEVPEGYKLTEGLTTEFYLHDKTAAENIKRSWQSQKVEGWRWYLPVHLTFYGIQKPREIDIETMSIENKSPVEAGSSSFAAVVFRNNGNMTEEFQANFYMNDQVIDTATIALDPGEEIEDGFAWTAPSKTGSVTLKAEAVTLPDEKDITNNTKSMSVNIIGAKAATCPKKIKVTDTWDETYSWTTTKHYTDAEGNSKSRKVRHHDTVTYTESLKAIISVNTKQGIPESTTESRGSWEIIPWAQKNGLDPNEVTRSGYGFEVKVQTTYTNDWETKVPGPASPKGGTYNGPTKVTANFFDTRGYQVDHIDMAPTKGKAGDQSITWELPVQSYTFHTGETIYERKHYTSVDVLDGNYGVRITVSEAGKNDLCLTQDKYVTIHGDMYDDTYTRIATKDE